MPGAILLRCVGGSPPPRSLHAPLARPRRPLLPPEIRLPSRVGEGPSRPRDPREEFDAPDTNAPKRRSRSSTHFGPHSTPFERSRLEPERRRPPLDKPVGSPHGLPRPPTGLGPEGLSSRCRSGPGARPTRSPRRVPCPCSTAEVVPQFHRMAPIRSRGAQDAGSSSKDGPTRTLYNQLDHCLLFVNFREISSARSESGADRANPSRTPKGCRSAQWCLFPGPRGPPRALPNPGSEQPARRTALTHAEHRPPWDRCPQGIWALWAPNADGTDGNRAMNWTAPSRGSWRDGAGKRGPRPRTTAPGGESPEAPAAANTPSFTRVPLLIYPDPRGEGCLKNADAVQPPPVSPHDLEDARDMQRLIQKYEFSRAITAGASLSQYASGQATPGPHACTEARLRSHIRLDEKNAFPPVGTRKMESSPHLPLTPNPGVHHRDELRGADASILPKIAGGDRNRQSIRIDEEGHRAGPGGPSRTRPEIQNAQLRNLSKEKLANFRNRAGNAEDGGGRGCTEEIDAPFSAEFAEKSRFDSERHP